MVRMSMSFMPAVENNCGDGGGIAWVGRDLLQNARAGFGHLAGELTFNAVGGPANHGARVGAH